MTSPPPTSLSTAPVGRQRRRRYPWRTWGEPGAGPFHVSESDVPRRHLAGVLRTWAARRGRQVRMLHRPDGLLFQFGPPFDAALDAAAITDVTADAVCPTCGRPTAAAELTPAEPVSPAPELEAAG